MTQNIDVALIGKGIGFGGEEESSTQSSEKNSRDQEVKAWQEREREVFLLDCAA